MRLDVLARCAHRFQNHLANPTLCFTRLPLHDIEKVSYTGNATTCLASLPSHMNVYAVSKAIAGYEMYDGFELRPEARLQFRRVYLAACLKLCGFCTSNGVTIPPQYTTALLDHTFNSHAFGRHTYTRNYNFECEANVALYVMETLRTIRNK